MSKKYKVAFISLFILWMLLLGFFVVYYCFGSAVLDPKGLIGEKERDLLVTSTWLMLIVVIPVFFMTLFITWKYRAENKNAKYSPDWDNNNLAEAIWWGLPCIIIIILSVLTWKGSHELDPFKPIENGVKPLKIQVVALQWKWLFLYPEQQIATVNFIQFPENTPIDFEITADAPMNSFWIPQLGGQIYAMPGMRTKLHLIAHEIGEYRGSSAHLSGKGFAGMVFTAKASSQSDFDAWAASLQNANGLGLEEYNELVIPSSYHPVAEYSLSKSDLFDQIIMKFMMPMER